MWLRSLVRLLVDVLMMFGATISALLLLADFSVSWASLVGLAPYLAATVVVAFSWFSICRLSRRIWRFSSGSDYFQIILSVAMVVTLVVAACIALGVFDIVPRSLPVLQAVLGAVALIGARVLVRIARDIRKLRKMRPKQFVGSDRPAPQVLLLVGATPLTEAYLSFIELLAAEKVSVAGVLDCERQYVGGLLRSCQVLGHVEDVGSVLEKLAMHGVFVDRIIVGATTESLSAGAQAALQRVVEQRGVVLQMGSDDLLRSVSQIVSVGEPMPSSRTVSDDANTTVSFPPALSHQLAGRTYWSVKRALDVVLALTLILVLAPLFAILAIVTAFDVGFPVLFWQQRPGLGGRGFRLFKFRTMRSAHDATGGWPSDHERTSRIGAVIRSLRLDELPQLFAILTGKMSFVGPRPLLPADQSSDCRCRLLIRPGLTGWAQVSGGRSLSALDKSALDLWYIQNASLLLDTKILIKTGAMLFTGERRQGRTIAEAWKGLRRAGVVRFGEENEEAHRLERMS